MRTVPQAMTDAWKAEDKTGDRRPTVRATIQNAHLLKFAYDTARAPGGSNNFANDRHRKGHFASMVFGHPAAGAELRNIKRYSWTRSVNQDVAECSITLKNTDLTPIGDQEEPEYANDFDQPGIMSPMRGGGPFGSHDPNPWGYAKDLGWNGRIVPDRLVKTYEGYGADPTVHPALDTHLVQSGTWLIDTADYTATGDIELKLRDVGRLLMDRICFPPIIPASEYPISFSKIHSENVPGRDVTGGSWVAIDRSMGTASSSNDLYVGKGITDGSRTYVGPNGGVQGHLASHVLTNKAGAYWWSTGQSLSSSRVWWQVNLNDHTTAMNGLRITPKGGPYRMWVSIKGKNGWIGRKEIGNPQGYWTEGVDPKCDIPFVWAGIVDKGLPFDVILKKTHGDIQAIRITFSRMPDNGVGNYPFHAGLKDIKIYTASSKSKLGFTSGQVQKTVGNYSDYTDIVKWALAWGGFFWPPHRTGRDFVLNDWSHIVNGVYTPADRTYVTFSNPDTVLPMGRVWGDLMNSGTAGVSDLTMDLFDKQPLFSIVSYVRDLLGFVFFIDELGAAIFRMPNLWKVGNYLSPTAAGDYTPARTTNVLEIKDDETLLSYTMTLDSKNLRERIFVGNTAGRVGTVIKGYNPYPQYFERIAGWTDQNFGSKQECKVMADMIAARQMQDYRRSKITIAGYPAIQIDDQIRVYERITSETYYEYVETITSSLDMETGQWHYDLETHWLGENPSDSWVVRVDQLDGATQTYLNTMGVT